MFNNMCVDIYWNFNGEEFSGSACYVQDGEDDRIEFVGTTTFDMVYADECDSIITLDDIWADLLAMRDEDGRLDVTDITLV